MHVTFLGGGFGRKSKPDFIVEAALLSRAVGAPVRVQWTREDDIRHGYYHAVSAQRIEAGLDAEQKLVAWRHRVASPSIGSTFDLKSRPPVGLGAAGAQRPPAERGGRAHRELPGARRTCGSAGCARSTTSTTASPRRASSASWPPPPGRDPKAMLLDVLGPARKLTAQEVGMKELMNAPDGYTLDVGRLRHVIERVAELSGWDAARRAGRAVGIAGYRGFLTYVAAVVAVSYDAKKQLRVDDVWLVADRRPGGQRGPGALAARGRGRLRPEPRALRRDHGEGGRHRAGELRRLPGAADLRGAAHAHRARGEPGARTRAPASRASRRSHRRSATRSSRSPASACARCRSSRPRALGPSRPRRSVFAQHAYSVGTPSRPSFHSCGSSARGCARSPAPRARAPGSCAPGAPRRPRA